MSCSKRTILVITCGIVLVSAIFLLVTGGKFLQVFDPSAKSTSVPLYNFFYTKNDILYYSSFDKIEPIAVGQYTDPHYYRKIYFIQVSEDGRRLFYPTNLDGIKAEISCRDLSSKRNTTVVVDSGINNYTINQDGSKIFYIKDYALYTSDLHKSEKIAAGIDKFFINKEGSSVVYTTRDGQLCRYTDSKEIVEIDSNVILKYVSLDLKTIYYLKGNALYCLNDGKDPRMIDTDVVSVLHVYEDGSFYYLKPNHVSVDTYVNDDPAVSSNLRHALKQNVIEDMKSLYYCSNGRPTMISEYCWEVWSVRDQRMLAALNSDASYLADKRPLLVFSKPRDFKVDISGASGYDDIYRQIEHRLYDDVDIYLCSGSEMLKKITDKHPFLLEYDLKNNKIYYAIETDRDKRLYSLHCVTIDGSKISEANIAEGVFITNILYGENIVYYKGTDSCPNRDMYINNRKIDSFSSMRDWRSDDYENQLMYVGENSDLMLYKDGKATKLADSITYYSYCTYGDKIAYYVSQDMDDDKTGSIYLYDGTENSKLIDTNVSHLEPLENFYYSCWDSTPAYEIKN